jgi:hypothetical protein
MTIQWRPACLDQRFGFGCEPRFSEDMPQFGKICSTEYVIKAGLCRRFSRRVNMIETKNPVKAPRNASVIERLLKVRSPWPVRRNPLYAIATVHRITRTGCMGDRLSMNKYCRSRREISLRVTENLGFFWFFHRSARICFHDDIHFCSRFELSFLTFIVGDHIVNANFSI